MSTSSIAEIHGTSLISFNVNEPFSIATIRSEHGFLLQQKYASFVPLKTLKSDNFLAIATRSIQENGKSPEGLFELCLHGLLSALFSHVLSIASTSVCEVPTELDAMCSNECAEVFMAFTSTQQSYPAYRVPHLRHDQLLPLADYKRKESLVLITCIIGQAFFTLANGSVLSDGQEVGSVVAILVLAHLRYIYTEGTVCLDGLPITNVNLDVLRSSITVIAQTRGASLETLFNISTLTLCKGTLRQDLSPFYHDATLNDSRSKKLKMRKLRWIQR
ncbi:hypothetical protein BYT27DRAFT_7260162 [Phlegmacium glaucopus]|nr:hypothetical protein BYT27DRAFT_7260162 [Phlegmacium glaucopus]